MYQEVEDDEESSTTTEDNEDVETVKTAADLGKGQSLYVHILDTSTLAKGLHGWGQIFFDLAWQVPQDNEDVETEKMEAELGKAHTV